MKKIFMIGNAHIDPVWLWTWPEGLAEVKATFQSALDRMKETDDFVFTCACAAYYAWVEENEPEMFVEIHSRVKEGRWCIVGGMWIQPDMNLPSAESLFRQMMISKRYFKNAFGIDVQTGYNVDSFGHGAFTPALLRKCGIKNYVWMRPGVHENSTIPEGGMIWKAADSSSVKAYRIPFEYTQYHFVTRKIEQVADLGIQLDQPMMCFYGVGNHGGGPTIENLREITDYQKNGTYGMQTVFGDPDRYFTEAAKEKLPQYSGELQHHASGCYSTHSESKLLHRKLENKLVCMDASNAMACALMSWKGNKAEQDRAWKQLCFNEFHDLLGGCALPEGMKDAIIGMNEGLSIAQRSTNAALQRISWHVDTQKGNPLRVRSKEEGRLWYANGQGTPVIVFNPHGFDTVDTVTVRQAIGCVMTDDGQEIPVQNVRASHLNGDDRFAGIFRAGVHALGYRLFWVYRQVHEQTKQRSSLRITAEKMENAHLCAEFADGNLYRITDKKSGKTLLNGTVSARLIDISACDTWAHGVNSFNKECGQFVCTGAEILENGPVRCSLKATYSFCKSSLLKIIWRLYEDARVLQADCTLDMHEKQRLVKLCFPLSGDSTETLAEVPGGTIIRKANGDEEPCLRFVCQDGLCILNDGKYSYSATQKEICMTVAHTSLYADHYGQNVRDEQAEMMDLGVQRFSLGLLAESSIPEMYQQAEQLNMPFISVNETYHNGQLPSESKGISISNHAIHLMCVKRSEQDDGYILHVQNVTDIHEKAVIKLEWTGTCNSVAFEPYECKAILFPDQGTPYEVLFTEIENNN